MGKTLKRNFLFTAATVALICGAVSSAYALDPTAKWCAGVKIAAFPGGPQGGVFANNVYNGYDQADITEPKSFGVISSTVEQPGNLNNGARVLQLSLRLEF